MSERRLGVIVLAAGEGTRMKSSLHKVLHPVCGKAMALHVIDAARQLEPSKIAVVVGHQAAAVRATVTADDIVFVDQKERLGTADAVRLCETALKGCNVLLVLNGDEPLVTSNTLAALVTASEGRVMGFVTQTVSDGGALGRVLRDGSGEVAAIVQAADYDGPAGAAEINWGEYVFEADWLWKSLPQIPVSPKGEYYLTKLADFAHEQGSPAVTIPADPKEALGVDDRVRLAEAETRMRARILEAHMLAGVTFIDPSTTYIDAEVDLAADVTVLPNCYLYGKTHVAANATIGPGTTLRSARIGEGSRVQASVVEDSTIGANVNVGPFAHVRGGAQIGDECELGNYAEVKNSVLGRGVKMHHFSYIGDADIGDHTNIAAGTITCNFDGVNKHRTTVGANAFIGSDTMLIAPITIGEGAITGAGAVVTRDVAAGAKVVGMPARAIRHRRREADQPQG
ncbi:MAG: bifunctional UDP-N-acetylglucosamine diphosphorylase/glucosamine-1-phosphate N-acetyltransferase GlmU [Tepidiformaceae bacterium]